MSYNIENSIIDICSSNFENLLSLPNVIGIGLGDKFTDNKNTNEKCIHVLVNKKIQKENLSQSDLIPTTYNHILTDVIEIGTIKALGFTSKIRPAKFGYSVGLSTSNSAGTAGCMVKSGSGVSVKYYILSNNHVIAGENNAILNTAILQPARLDGGVFPADQIATLSKFIPILFETPTTSPINEVDCAIGLISNHNLITPEINWIGFPKGIVGPTLNTTVKKAGRTTGLTEGTILTIGATVRVTYSNNKTALFKNQIITNSISAGGDSGSLLLDMNDNAIGLLFAGSNVATIYNPISSVLNQLQVLLVTS